MKHDIKCHYCGQYVSPDQKDVTLEYQFYNLSGCAELWYHIECKKKAKRRKNDKQYQNI